MPKPKQHFFATVVLACPLLLSLAACGAMNDSSQSETDTEQLFDVADGDHDKAISAQEWEGQSDSVFSALDSSGDARLDPQELEAGFDVLDQDDSGLIDVREAPVLVGQADADGDNLVSPEEFEVFEWSAFKGDLDKDGLVDPEEFRQPRRELFNASDHDRDDRLKRHEFDDSARFTLFRW
jgi:Ca2+-binding EF-hand superfamily protein